ncbi:hypothetical protein L9F63_015092 [Diploptera punctata]|uniref:Uncharacterized protein n=1 Tax=Diploptera punctata TaxID=6984 RepID=A0AAD8A6R7_DIPPU|nr:hypothetical protein L9F63_015092 [Diploptera punctata]
MFAILYNLTSARPHVEYFNIKIPHSYSGFIATMNPDGTHSVRYLSEEEAQSMILDEKERMQHIMSGTMHMINRIFSSIPFFG